jgi:imidazole glycerol-phosphate synthase subunit HisH
MIGIVDYGMGNLGSIRNMLKRVGVESVLVTRPEDILAAPKLILPGVGAFDAGMKNLNECGLVGPLNEAVLGARRVPILGICLGMQLMARASSEGERAGLGWISAGASKFESGDGGLKVPHMAWNSVRRLNSAPLTDELPEEPRFYFVHSYFIRCDDPDDALLATKYGVEFHSAFHRGNIWGVQFHPEKSHKFGMQLLSNFARCC